MAKATIFTDNEAVAVYTVYGESVAATLKNAGARWNPGKRRGWLQRSWSGGIELKDWTAIDTARLVAYCETNSDREAFWALAKRISDEFAGLPYQAEISASEKSCYVSFETKSFIATIFARFDGQRLSFEAKFVDDVPADIAERLTAIAEKFNYREEK